MEKYTIDELLQKPYWVIDILPKQVPADSQGQYAAVEHYYLDRKRIFETKHRHVDLVLKLNCYRDICMDENHVNPSPKLLAYEMLRRHMDIRIGDALLVSEPDETHLTLYNANNGILELARLLAQAEGLFVWQPENN